MASVNGFRSEFSWDELNEITDKFSTDNLIGETENFQLFRGFISPSSENGTQLPVTVKLWKDSVTFLDKLRRMKEECTFLAHPKVVKCSNVVNVVGYCCDGEHIGAVYELNSVSTLENYLAKDEFQWRDRIIVAHEIARLFHFLEHSESTHLIHVALPPCVILDQEMNPVLCDIGILTSIASQLIEGSEDLSIARLTLSSSEGTHVLDAVKLYTVLFFYPIFSTWNSSFGKADANLLLVTCETIRHVRLCMTREIEL
ncbi:hypothetical protein RND81_09G230000 [Saponaria officinalis]|uniref:Protein kinase domain-containing protein n=1 Tax=Saponaria officinalis TaxID=3572 RepID=A0AAW1IR77_SAPOF